jgi:hypothetical protein
VAENRRRRERAILGELTMTGGKQKIVDAIAQLNALGVEKPSIIQVALFNGVSHTRARSSRTSASSPICS